MAERSSAHDWKSTLLARADAHEIPPTQFRINDFRNIDTRRRVLVNHRVDRGFEGSCDTVLTQSGFDLAAVHINEYQTSWDRTRQLRLVLR